MVNGTSFYFIISTDKTGPALGRLDRFDALSPHSYGDPALMGRFEH